MKTDAEFEGENSACHIFKKGGNIHLNARKCIIMSEGKRYYNKGQKSGRMRNRRGPARIDQVAFFHRLRVRYHLYKVQAFSKNPFSSGIIVAWDYFELSEYFK